MRLFQSGGIGREGGPGRLGLRPRAGDLNPLGDQLTLAAMLLLPAGHFDYVVHTDILECRGPAVDHDLRVRCQLAAEFQLLLLLFDIEAPGDDLRIGVNPHNPALEVADLWRI